MRARFVFRKVLYLTETSGRRARTLDDLFRLVTIVDPESIGYHMHREFLAYKFVHGEFPNDFAHWTARVLGDEIVAERLAAIRAFKYPTLADVQREVARVLADHTLAYPAAATETAPLGREFVFCTARKFILSTGHEASSLAELRAAIAEVEASSLFYHLFETRYAADGAERPNDFALWVGEALGRPDVAARLSSFDPYMFSTEQSRRVLLSILGEAQKEAGS